MNKLILSSAVAAFACGALAETVSTVVDYVTLNGNSPENLVKDTYRSDIVYAYDDVNNVWKTDKKDGTGNGFVSNSTIEDFNGRTGVLKIESVASRNDAWQGVCAEYAIATSVPLKHAQTVSFPYYYSGTGMVNKDLRIVVYAGNNSFSIGATEKMVAGAWATATFNLSDVFAEQPMLYAADKENNIVRVRIYWGGFTSATSTSDKITVTSFNFKPGEAIYFGPLTYSRDEVSYYTVSFDANGGVPIADMQTDANFQLTLPTPVRDGFTFLGWFYGGLGTAAGTTVDVVQDCTYAAGWTRTDPSAGLTQGDLPYKRLFDMYCANGSSYGIVGNLDGITYFPDEDRYVHTSSASVVVTPAVSAGETNVQVRASSSGSKWTTPFVHPRLPSLKLSDICEVRILYSYTGSSGNVIGKPLVFYYKIGNTWRHLEGDAAFAATEAGAYNEIRVKVKDSLGDDYKTLKDESISDWKFYFYGGTAQDSGFKNDGWSIGGTFVFRPLELLADHPDGITIIIR